MWYLNVVLVMFRVHVAIIASVFFVFVFVVCFLFVMCEVK